MIEEVVRFSIRNLSGGPQLPGFHFRSILIRMDMVYCKHKA